jgi:hypothetical protein
MGVSSGFDFDTVAAGTSRGSPRCACATLACTSWSARSTSRDRSNVTVRRAEPCRAVEATCCTPSTCASACSIGSRISRSTAVGEAPAHERLTEMFG